MEGLGLVGFTTLTSGGLVAPVGTAVRVFDFCRGNTGTATTSNAVLWDMNASGTTTFPVMTVTYSQPTNNPTGGIRFPFGCYCLATGITATVSFIREF